MEEKGKVCQLIAGLMEKTEFCTDQEQLNWHAVVTNYGDLDGDDGAADRGSKCQSIGDTTGLLHTFSHTLRSYEDIIIVSACHSFFLRKATVLVFFFCVFFLPPKNSILVCTEEHFLKVASERATQLF